MIEKIYYENWKVNQYIVTCDNCGAGRAFDIWTDLLEYMFEEGWKKELVDGEWKHYCLKCQEKEAE